MASGPWRAKLDSEEGRAVYAQRKAVVEPVFGQVKEVRGFRRFSLRGRELASKQWQLICLTPPAKPSERERSWFQPEGQGRGASAARSPRKGDRLHGPGPPAPAVSADQPAACHIEVCGGRESGMIARQVPSVLLHS